MVLLWRIPDNYPESAIGAYDKAVSVDRFLLKQGCTLAPPFSRPVVRFSRTIDQLLAYECLPNNALVPLVNAELAHALQKLCGSDVQFVPALVVGSNGETDEFSFLNATACVRGIDHSVSRYKFVPGSTQIMSFQRLHYLPDSLGAHHLARDIEYKSHLLASGAVLSVLNAMQAKGVELVSAESIGW